jgi:hypothetical protein
MKNSILQILFILLLGLITTTATAQIKTRWYPFKGREIHGFDGGTISFKDSTLFLAPSLSIDLFVRESQSGAYKIGAIPGIGYGLKYKPKKWESGFLIGIDVFAQANLVDEIDTHSGFDYFNIDILPVVTLFNWIGVGYGPRFKIGLNGIPSTNRGLFSFGLRKSF